MIYAKLSGGLVLRLLSCYRVDYGDHPGIPAALRLILGGVFQPKILKILGEDRGRFGHSPLEERPERLAIRHRPRCS